MSQKINPTSLRIGQQFSWNITYQTYGKTLVNTARYHSSFFLFSFLVSKTNSKLLNTNFKLFVLPHKFKITKLVTPFHLSNEVYTYIDKFKLQNSSCKTWYPKDSDFNFFVSSSFFCSAQLITFYFKLLLKKNIIFKKVILFLINFLCTQIGMKKIIYSKFGVKTIKLKGFKLTLTGRFENTKNQMAKKLEYTVGSLSLLSISSYVEFCDLNIYSKLGVCNFKIWLFYQ